MEQPSRAITVVGKEANKIHGGQTNLSADDMRNE